MSRNFGTLLGEYLSVYEFHTESEFELLDRLRDQIGVTTFGEIIDQYNKLTLQKLWVPPVVSTFHDELLNRLNGTTFMISTSWTRPEVTHVSVQIGYDDGYLVLNEFGVPITEGEAQSFSLLNDSFTPADEKIVQRIILGGHPMVVLSRSGEVSDSHRLSRGGASDRALPGEVSDSQRLSGEVFVINEIFNEKDPAERVRHSEPTEPTIILPAKVYEAEEFYFLRRMIQGIRDEDFPLVNPLPAELE